MSEPVKSGVENNMVQGNPEGGQAPVLSLKERYFLEILKRGGKLPPNAGPRVRQAAFGAQPASAPVRQAPFGAPPASPPVVVPVTPMPPELAPARDAESRKEAVPCPVPARPQPEKRQPGGVPRARRTASFASGDRFLKTQRLSQVDMSAPVWVVRCPRGDGLLPAGLSVLVGDPGAGKSTLIRALVANLSTGSGPFPLKEPAGTLFLAWEDDERSGILPHLVACGGDPSRVHMLRGVSDTRGDDLLWIPTPDNLELVRAFLEAHPEVRLVVVDVLSSLLALGGVDSSGSEEVRRLLDPLHRMGQESGVAVLPLHHQNKRVGEKALVRVAGSVQVTGTARLVWLLASDPADPGLRQLAPVKCNLPGRSRGFAFREVPVGRDEVARLAAKVGTPVPDNLPDCLFRRLEIAEGEPVSAEELLGGLAEPKETVGDKADEWLEATLAGNRGEIGVCALAKLAREQGLGDKALAGAKARLKSAGKIRYQKRDDGWWVVSQHWELIALTNAQFPSPSPGVDL